MIGLDETTRGKAYLLMDSALFDAPRFIYENDDQPELEYLFLGTHHEPALKVTPCLVKPSEATRLWRAQPEWQDKAVVLVSDECMPVVAGHLRSLLSVQLPEGGFSYLRFYAPKQLQRLMSALNEQERTRFSGPVREWLVFQPDGELSRFGSDGSQPARKAVDEGWFLLTDTHVAALARSAREEFVEKLGRFLDIKDQARLEQWIGDATALGFQTEKDVSRYAELALVHGERLKLAEIQAILSDPELSIGARLKAVDTHLAYGVA
ncbi:DUF4123 domain-containing protein [Marinobacter sp. NFXS11]|uniref:DUF4123 domain-containing protein n=1 Tax=Marinobacter sp. NFXS11 TaxID=2818432 RepID=UPI0032DF4699